MSLTIFRSCLTIAAGSVLVALAGCGRPATDTVAAQETGFRLDESQLLQPVRFRPADIDESVSACVDLNARTNGKWLAANPIPADQERWGGIVVLRERSLQVRKQIAEQLAARDDADGVGKIVADFWATGMDEAKLEAQGIAPLADGLAAIEALADGPAVAQYIRTVAARGANPLFLFWSESGFIDPSVKIGYAEQGGLSLPDRTYYFDADKQEIRDAFVKHIARMLELSGLPATDAALRARDVMVFETRLARASKSQEDMSRDVSLYNNPVTPAAADRLTPNFPWTKFFESQGLAPPEVFSLVIPDFHREVDRMLADVPVAQWKSYLRFRLVDGGARYLGSAFTDARFDFYNRTLNGQPEQRPRWTRVLSLLEESAGEAMGQLYVQVAFPPESRTRMEELVANLLAALKVRLANVEWMSDATRARALAKWASFTPKIGYPSKWRDWSGLATSRDSFYANAMAAAQFNYRWDIGKIGKPTDRSEWGMTPQTVNAYYHPLLNEVVFPAAILQPPFFDPAADDAYNYAAIGGMIGHELIHGYDDQGSRFGPDGKFEEWWTAGDRRKFEARTARLVQQYNQYEALPGLRVNGNLTLGENIADLGGLSIALDALRRATEGKPDTMADGLTRDQRFFHGWATAWRLHDRPETLRVQVASDPHAPDPQRANGPPSNMPEFAAAFGCKDSDPGVNAGERRVSIW